MKKRILSLVLALSMMISLFPVSALAQTPGGGGAVLAEENGETATPIEIAIGSDGKPVGDDGAGGTNWEYAGTDLYLHQGTYTFSAPVTCGVIIYNGATVAGGTFEGTVWNEPGGKISGGTFKKAVSNKGVIEGGTFTGEKNDDSKDTTCAINYEDGKIIGGTFEKTVKNYGVIKKGTIRFCDNYGTIENGTFNNPNGMFCIWNYNLISGGVFEQGVKACANDEMASKITDGTFKSGFYTTGSGEGTTVEGGTFASPPTNATGNAYSVSIGSWSGKCNIAINGVDFGENLSVYIVGQNYNDVKITATAFDTYTDTKTNTTKKFKEWQISSKGETLNAVDGGTVDLTQKEIKFIMPNSYGEITLAAIYETVAESTDGPELEFISGYEIGLHTNVHFPVGTDGGTKKADGKGWSYVPGINGEYGTLTLTDGTYDLLRKQPTNPASEKVHSPIGVKLVVSSGAVVTDSCLVDAITIKEGGKIASSASEPISVRNDIIIKKGGIIENAKFVDAKIQNSGTIKNGIYSGSTDVTNNAGGVIEDGTFYSYVDVINNAGGRIEGGTYYCAVVNNANAVIADGLFVKGLSTSEGASEGSITGGIFNLSDEIAEKFSSVLHKVTAPNCKVRMDGNGTNWNLYAAKDKMLKLQLMGNDHLHATVYNLNGKTDAYDATGLGTTTVSFTMPNEDVVLNKTAMLTVQNDIEGTVSDASEGSVIINKLVNLTAAKQTGYYFTGWTVSDGVTLTNSGGNVNLGSERIAFDMPAENVTLTATYAKNPKYTLTVDGGYIGTDKNQISGDYEAGATIKLTANDAADGKEFDKWVLNGGLELYGDGELTNEVIWVTITGTATATATYKDKAPTTYTLTVENGYIGDDETKISGDYEAGATIKLTAKDAVEGKEFDKWELDGLTLVDDYQETNATIEVTITGNATATATYKAKTVTPTPGGDDDQPKTYTITTDIYGKVNGGASATVKENDWVHMTVAEVPEGMTFDYWNIPDALLKALQKQNSGFRNNVESLSFQMPNMGEEEQTFAIKANFRSSELPGEDDGPSTLGTMATVAVGGAAAGILVWQGVSLGVDSYLQLNLPKGVAVPANRRELVVLLWETAGKPEAALPSLYSDVPAEEIELQKATRWAIDNGLVKPADDNDASRFDPDRYVTKYDVFGAWLKLKKLMK